ncbi:PEP-CTERM-box response regulator transcription factor [Magnetospira sp. QH-2]|uniref:PEP-CTERM-box response regulator transcription factor n=1 Tax=Magnetospira sp. (strain QH-2) TaxID=1288970 RepID=UPI0003E8124E|nr:PEP-CTERM-box response regulator transcription factor [Magnetospira sp. QH-2]CCQ72871.1 Acetoacetate metabolism regulatory protein atoC [Magnetospira sp. QH-2]
MARKSKALVVEDDDGLRSQMRWALADDDVFEIMVAGNRKDAMTTMRKEEPTIVVLDLGLPPDPNGASEGLATLEEILTFRPLTKVIIASGNEDRNNALKAVSLGAYDFYPKPVDIDELRLIMRRALRLYELEEENQRYANERKETPLGGIIAGSPEMLSACRMIERLAPSDVSVLVMGESGTGKDLMAHALHEMSPRAKGPYVAINCAAIPEHLLESELFGYEKGAFTGAHKQTIGKVEQANKGTLFLDEIGDMPLNLQSKMLRFLQNRVIDRIGGRSEIKVDVRVVSATNQPMEEMIADGRFREDLYYRLDEVNVRIPALRERSGDKEVLAKFFLDKFARDLDRPVKGFTSGALAAISSYEWPGNVRELENRIKRAVVLADGKLLSEEDLNLEAGEVSQGFPTLKDVREKAEYNLVMQALELNDNNVSAAAKLLGVSRPTLYGLMKTLNIRT